MPTVSVIIPNFNHARFLPRRIESVLNQTWRDLEVIYLDDASTDESAAVYARYAGEARMRAVLNTVNTGSPFKQWNKGVSLARGRYVWIAEADDAAEPDFLTTLVPLLEAHPNVGLAYCQSIEIDEHDKPYRNLIEATRGLDAQHWAADYIAHGPTEVTRYLGFQCTIPNASACLIRRDAFDRAGGAEEGMRLCGDWMTWVRLLGVSDVAFCARPMNYFRGHAGNVRTRVRRAGVGLSEHYRILHAIRTKFDMPEDVFERAAWYLAGKWVQAAVFDRPRLDWSAHRAIHRDARRVDRHVYRKLLSMYLQKRKARRAGQGHST